MSRRSMTLGALAVAALAGGLLWRSGGGEAPREEAGEPEVAVHVAALARGAVRRTVTAYGYVGPEPAHDGRPAAGVVLSPFTAGVLAEVAAVEGRRVEKGAVLFRLDSRLQTVAVERARQEVEFAETTLARQERLLETDGTSRRAVQEARQRLDQARNGLAAAETELAYRRITAPLAGTIGRVEARVGQAVDAHSVLGTIVDATRLTVAADVPAGEAEGLAVGQEAALGSGSDAPRGRLVIVGRDLDPRTGTYRVHASVPAEAGLSPGQFIDVHIVAAEHEGVLLAPEVAVVTRGGEGSWLMVVEGERATRRPVATGFRENGLVEVAAEGLDAGISVVTTEAYGLPERTRVRVLER